MSVDLGSLYASSRWRLTDLLTSTMNDTTGAVPCPATPGWCVHDVIAHLRGVAEDVRAGNLDGVATDPWTAAQVERHRDDSVATLLDDWATDAAPLEEFLSGPYGEGAARAVIDAHIHEMDVRAALGYPVSVPAEFGTWAMPLIASVLIEGSAAAGLPPVRVVTVEGDSLGEADAAVVLTVSRLELLRAAMGRRSPAQVSAWDWGGHDPTPYLANVFVFGPRQDDLTE
jgi:uncharacterized protein (TIGR03083 family)